jgi:hypothetical protein
MAMKLLLKVEVKDKHGKVINNLKEFETHSWTRWFINKLSHLFNVLNITSGNIATDASSNTFGATDQLLIFRMAVGDGSTRGPVVGTDDTPFADNQSTLGAQVVAGWTYGNIAFVPPSTSSNHRQLGITRGIVNGTGVSVDIKEVGIYATIRTQPGTDKIFLIERTVLPSTVTVPDGGTITVSYTVRGA